MQKAMPLREDVRRSEYKSMRDSVRNTVLNAARNTVRNAVRNTVRAQSAVARTGAWGCRHSRNTA